MGQRLARRQAGPHSCDRAAALQSWPPGRAGQGRPAREQVRGAGQGAGRGRAGAGAGKGARGRRAPCCCSSARSKACSSCCSSWGAGPAPGLGGRLTKGPCCPKISPSSQSLVRLSSSPRPAEAAGAAAAAAGAAAAAAAAGAPPSGLRIPWTPSGVRTLRRKALPATHQVPLGVDHGRHGIQHIRCHGDVSVFKGNGRQHGGDSKLLQHLVV
jgi:hypothetical protein